MHISKKSWPVKSNKRQKLIYGKIGLFQIKYQFCTIIKY
jgi:hypothetical protein